MKRAAFLLAVALATPAWAADEFDDTPVSRPVIVKRAPVERLTPLVVRPLPVPVPVVIDPPPPAKVVVPAPVPAPEPKPVPIPGLRELPPAPPQCRYTRIAESYKFDPIAAVRFQEKDRTTARIAAQNGFGTDDAAYKLNWRNYMSESHAAYVEDYQECLAALPSRTAEQQAWFNAWTKLQTFIPLLPPAEPVRTCCKS